MMRHAPTATGASWQQTSSPPPREETETIPAVSISAKQPSPPRARAADAGRAGTVEGVFVIIGIVSGPRRAEPLPGGGRRPDAPAADQSGVGRRPAHSHLLEPSVTEDSRLGPDLARSVRKRLFRRLQTRDIPLDRVRTGGYAEREHRLLRDSPHVAFLREFGEADEVDPERFRQSAYYAHGLGDIARSGSFFGIDDPDRIIEQARYSTRCTAIATARLASTGRIHDPGDLFCRPAPVARCAAGGTGHWDGHHRCAIHYVPESHDPRSHTAGHLNAGTWIPSCAPPAGTTCDRLPAAECHRPRPGRAHPRIHGRSRLIAGRASGPVAGRSSRRVCARAPRGWGA